MAIPDWVEIIGKLAPASVALAVYMTARAQNRWMNAVQARTASVEDQKLRLALLDKRLAAIEAIRSAHADFVLQGDMAKNLSENLVAALRVAELVFDQQHEQAIDATFKQAYRRQLIVDRVERLMSRANADDAEMDQLYEALDALDRDLSAALPDLRETLLQASRVTLVPPLRSEKPFLSRLRARAPW